MASKAALPTKAAEPTETPPVGPDAFFQALEHRRTIYALNDQSPVSDVEIEAILRRVMLTVPSAFNTQSTRAVLLLHGHQTHFWNEIVIPCILDADHIKKEAEADPDKIDRTRKRLAGFGAAYGTVLFFETEQRIQKLLGMARQYGEDECRSWSEHTNAMHQIVAWTALEAVGFGANLQHYNYQPTVAPLTRKWLGLSDEWDLTAQLVFGGVVQGKWPTSALDKDDPGESVTVFGST